jgi:hypothetical protein
MDRLGKEKDERKGAMCATVLYMSMSRALVGPE